MFIFQLFFTVFSFYSLSNTVYRFCNQNFPLPFVYYFQQRFWRTELQLEQVVCSVGAVQCEWRLSGLRMQTLYIFYLIKKKCVRSCPHTYLTHNHLKIQEISLLHSSAELSWFYLFGSLGLVVVGGAVSCLFIPKTMPLLRRAHTCDAHMSMKCVYIMSAVGGLRCGHILSSWAPYNY